MNDKTKQLYTRIYGEHFNAPRRFTVKQTYELNNWYYGQICMRSMRLGV